MVLTIRHRDAVSLRIERVADLHEVTVALRLVLDARRFHEERVLALQHPVHPLLVAGREHRGVGRLHHAPHPLVQAHVRFLQSPRDRTGYPYTNMYHVSNISTGTGWVIF